MFYGLKTVKQLKKKKYLNYFKFCLYPCTRVTFTYIEKCHVGENQIHS